MMHADPLGNKAKAPDEGDEKQEKIGLDGMMFFHLHSREGPVFLSSR